MRFSLAVPTYKRPDTLRATLESVLESTRFPDEVLVIDDDTLPADFLAEMQDAFSAKGVPFAYHRKDHATMRRGLSETKNWAAQLAQYDIVCFLDDDVVLEPEYFAQLMAAWEERAADLQLAGIGGRAINNRGTTPMEKVFRRIFGLTGECAWDVNGAGFQVWDESVEKAEQGYYLHGCSSSYRRELLRAMPFATFAGGRTALEDVEHCLRAKQAGYHFLYAPEARLVHHQAPVGRDAAFTAGIKESRNRKEIFRTLCRQDLRHTAWFWWANVGWTLKKLLAFKFRQAGGMIVGLFGARSL